MWVSSISPPNWSLIGPPITDIYYQTGIELLETHTDRHTDTLPESDNLPIKDLRSELSYPSSRGSLKLQFKACF